MKNDELRSYDEWAKNGFEGIERLKYHMKKDHNNEDDVDERKGNILEILNTICGMAEELLQNDDSSDEKEKIELGNRANEDYRSTFKGLDTNGDMEDEYMNDLKEKHKEFLAKKFKSDLKKDYIQKKKKTHLRITIDIQEVDDDEE
jgi:hypothetical protein